MSAQKLFASAGAIVRTQLTRKDLARMFAELGFTTGAEIGVWTGGYSMQLCQTNPTLSLTCIDPWVSYPAWVDKKNKPRHNMEAIYRTACLTLSPYRCTIRREYSAEASKAFKEGSLDFVFIDGNHVYDAVVEDLKLWAPKVRKGGIVAGHDYRVYTGQPEIQVERAVNEYVAVHGIAPVVTFDGDKGAPSFAWMVR